VSAEADWRSEVPKLRDMLKGMRLLMLGFLATAGLLAQPAVQIRTGPEVGSSIPMFQAPDQNGHEQTLQSVAGPKGTLLVFYRSADW
jgi:hypothetical protein